MPHRKYFPEKFPNGEKNSFCGQTRVYSQPLECKNACYCVFPPDQDGAEPSANSVSAFNLLRLSHYTGRQEWLQKSKRLLAAFTDRLTRVPIALPEMVRALMAQHYTLKQVFALLAVQLAISFSVFGLCKRVTYIPL